MSAICGLAAGRFGADPCDLREATLPPGCATCFDADPMAKARTTKTTKKPTCDDCFFRCNLLCALSVDEPCATYRPDHPEGLRPPRQLRFHFRQPGRTTAAWAFPSAQEQAALHG